MGSARVYVIIGDPQHPFPEPPYPTDPRVYGVPVFKQPLSDEEFDRDCRAKVKAFIDREHAIIFAHYCNLVSVWCQVYDADGEGWVLNHDEAGRLAEDIN
jgi:hypothetical protein